MKSNILSLLVFTAIFAYTTTTRAQVGIGTNSPSASAQLEVNSSSKGFLPPRVTLTGTADVTTIASPATGLLVYNTATAGASPSNVTPGFYYYDGSKWQRVINQQPDATISFNQNTPTTGGVVFTPNTQNSTDYIYVSSTNGSQWTYNGSAYVTYSPPASTAWYLSGGSTDAGSNKTGTVYRTGSVGIGAATTPDANAQLDVNSTTKGFLPPRMTSTQRNAITSPAGLIVYNSTDNRLDVRQNTTWRSMATLDGTETLTNKTISGSSNTINNVSLTSGVTGTLPVANGGTGVTTATGSGNAVLATSPTLVTPVISTTTSSSTAGAIRYNTGNGGILEYSNGTEWKPLAATKKVAVYTEVHTDASNTGWYSSGTAFNDFGSITADNVVDVYGSSYGFFNGTGTGSSSDRWVAPFTGKYRVTTNVYFNHNTSYANPRVYAYKNNTTICNITSVNTGGQDIATCTSAVISMNQGDYINWRVEYSSQIWRGLYHTFFRIESVE